jgi:branched-chain amino acid transport system substrate-binding protein
LDRGSINEEVQVKSIVRRKVLAASALAIGAALATPVALAQAKAPLRFGVAMPLTGSQALFGVDFVTAAKWAVADINAKGGVEGHPLEMVVLDTQAEPQTGISAVNRLIHVDKVPVFVTAWSGVVKAVAPIANREKVLAFSVGANSPEIAKLGEYVFTTYPLADVDIDALARYTFKNLGKKRAAVLYINNESGVEGARTYRAAFELAGRWSPSERTTPRLRISRDKCSRHALRNPTSSISRVLSPTCRS